MNLVKTDHEINLQIRNNREPQLQDVTGHFFWHFGQYPVCMREEANHTEFKQVSSQKIVLGFLLMCNNLCTADYMNIE